MRPLVFWQILKTAGSQWLDDKASLLGAALAYYTIFSIAPLLVIAVAIGGLLFGEKAVEGHVAHQLEDVLGADGAQTVQTMLVNAHQPTSGIVATVIGGAMLFFGAAGLFVQLQDVMNTIWKVRPKPGRALRNFIRDRLLSFVMVLGTAVLLFVSLGISTALHVVGSLLGDWETTARNQVFHVVASLVIFTLQFGLLYLLRIVPDAKIRFPRRVAGRRTDGGLLFTLGEVADRPVPGASRHRVGLRRATRGSFPRPCWCGCIIRHRSFCSAAEFTKAHAEFYGTPIVPTDNAVAVPTPPSSASSRRSSALSLGQKRSDCLRKPSPAARVVGDVRRTRNRQQPSVRQAADHFLTPIAAA